MACTLQGQAQREDAQFHCIIYGGSIIGKQLSQVAQVAKMELSDVLVQVLLGRHAPNRRKTTRSGARTVFQGARHFAFFRLTVFLCVAVAA